MITHECKLKGTSQASVVPTEDFDQYSPAPRARFSLLVGLSIRRKRDLRGLLVKSSRAARGLAEKPRRRKHTAPTPDAIKQGSPGFGGLGGSDLHAGALAVGRTIHLMMVVVVVMMIVMMIAVVVVVVVVAIVNLGINQMVMMANNYKQSNRKGQSQGLPISKAEAANKNTRNEFLFAVCLTVVLVLGRPVKHWLSCDIGGHVVCCLFCILAYACLFALSKCRSRGGIHKLTRTI